MQGGGWSRWCSVGQEQVRVGLWVGTGGVGAGVLGGAGAGAGVGGGVQDRKESGAGVQEE